VNKIPEKNVTRDLRLFGWTVGGVLLAVGVLLLLRGHLSSGRILAAAGALLVLGGTVAPRALALPYRLWMGFARALGWFNTRLLLILVFYLILTPLGLILRLTGKRPLDLKRDPEAQSYWIRLPREPFDPSRSEKHF
jgi:hypothetical protein